MAANAIEVIGSGPGWAMGAYYQQCIYCFGDHGDGTQGFFSFNVELKYWTELAYPTGMDMRHNWVLPWNGGIFAFRHTANYPWNWTITPMRYDIATDSWNTNYGDGAGCGYFFEGGPTSDPIIHEGQIYFAPNLNSKGMVYNTVTNIWRDGYGGGDLPSGFYASGASLLGCWSDKVWVTGNYTIYYDFNTLAWTIDSYTLPSRWSVIAGMQDYLYLTDGNTIKEWSIVTKAWTGKTSPTLPYTILANRSPDYESYIYLRSNNPVSGTASPSFRWYLMVYDTGVSPISGDWLFIATTRHSQLEELNLDNHTQYLNNTRHDVTARHTLGTVVPHDDHGLLSGLADDDHTQYYNASRLPAAVNALLKTVGRWEPIITGASDTTPDFIMSGNDIVMGFKE